MSFLKKLTGNKTKEEQKAEFIKKYGREWKDEFIKVRVIRINEGQPAGFQRKLFNYKEVTAVSYYQDNLSQFAAGDGRSLELIPEQRPNKTAVWGSWKDKAGDHKEVLGYLPKEIAYLLGRLDPPGYAATLDTLVNEDGFIGIRISIWGKRGAVMGDYDPKA